MTFFPFFSPPTKYPSLGSHLLSSVCSSTHGLHPSSTYSQPPNPILGCSLTGADSKPQKMGPEFFLCFSSHPPGSAWFTSSHPPRERVTEGWVHRKDWGRTNSYQVTMGQRLLRRQSGVKCWPQVHQQAIYRAWPSLVIRGWSPL